MTPAAELRKWNGVRTSLLGFLRILGAAMILLLAPRASLAQNRWSYDTDDCFGNTGDWDGCCWCSYPPLQPGIPTNGDYVILGHYDCSNPGVPCTPPFGGSCGYQSDFTIFEVDYNSFLTDRTLQQVVVDVDTAEGGRITLSQGTGWLQAMYEVVGYCGQGHYLQINGFNTITTEGLCGVCEYPYGLILGYNAGSYGDYVMLDGVLNDANGNMIVGYNGSGHFAQGSSSLAQFGDLYLGYWPGSVGDYELKGGSVDASDEVMGYYGTGTFTQSSGGNSCSFLGIGSSSPASSVGVYQLLGGSLSASSEIQVGGTGQGSFIQSGGTLSTPYFQCDGGSLYETVGGALSAQQMSLYGRTRVGLSQFNQTIGVVSNLYLGGELDVSFANGFQNTITNGTSFTLLTSPTVINDAYTNIASGSRLATTDGYGSFVVTYGGSNLVLSAYQGLLDPDGSGLPTAWEIQYFGHTGVDPNADPDGDGFSNLQEFLAGTNPTNSSSFPQLTFAWSGPDAALSFQSVFGKTYAVEYKNNISDAAWSVLTKGVTGTGLSMQFSDPGAATNCASRFYRLDITP
jgi:hypothetical protein